MYKSRQYFAELKQQGNLSSVPLDIPSDCAGLAYVLSFLHIYILFEELDSRFYRTWCVKLTVAHLTCFVPSFQHQISCSTRKRDEGLASTAILWVITLVMITTLP